MYSLILSPGFGAFDELLKRSVLALTFAPGSATTTSRSMFLIIISCWAYIGVPLMAVSRRARLDRSRTLRCRALDGAKPRQIVPLCHHTGIAAGGARRPCLSVIQSLFTFDVVSVMTSGRAGGRKLGVFGYFMYSVTFSRQPNSAMALRLPLSSFS